MALIEIEAEDVEPIEVRLVGVNYIINPPKTSLTMELAESVSAKKVTANKDGKELTPEEKKKILEGKVKVSKKLMGALHTWIEQAFGDEAPAIHKRLKNPKDRLDWHHVMKLMQQVSELVTGDPTT